MRVRIQQDEMWPVYRVADDDDKSSPYLEIPKGMLEDLIKATKEFNIIQNAVAKLWQDQVDDESYDSPSGEFAKAVKVLKKYAEVK